MNWWFWHIKSKCAILTIVYTVLLWDTSESQDALWFSCWKVKQTIGEDKWNN